VSFAAYVKDLDCLVGFFVLFFPRPLTINSLFKAPQLSQLASVLPSIQISPPIETALLNFSIAVLTAGDMSIATSTGRLFITEALKVPKFGASLLGALAELSWGGWKLVALPALFRSTGDLLATEPKQTLRLFASLCHSDKLGEVDIVWRHTIDLWLCERSSYWELSPDGVDELRNLLSLSVYAEKMPALLVAITQRMLDASDPEASWNASHVNATWVLSTCMHALVGSKNESWRQQVDLAGWTRMVVQRWSWSQCALAGLASLVQSR
jgi:U3 small nucleolar RNA-associated protein 20